MAALSLLATLLPPPFGSTFGLREDPNVDTNSGTARSISRFEGFLDAIDWEIRGTSLNPDVQDVFYMEAIDGAEAAEGLRLHASAKATAAGPAAGTCNSAKPNSIFAVQLRPLQIVAFVKDSGVFCRHQQLSCIFFNVTNLIQTNQYITYKH